ncbi:Meiotic central spindle [Carabus blaptoides fortunei]
MWPSKNNMYICSKCLSHLQKACDFINKCRNSYKLLQGYAHQLNRNDSSTGKTTDLIDLFDEESNVACNNLDSAVVVKIESTEILNSLLNNCDKDPSENVNCCVDSNCSSANSPELNFVDVKSNEYFNTETVQEVNDKNPFENVNQELEFVEAGSVLNLYDSTIEIKDENVEMNLLCVKESSVKKTNVTGDINRHICPVCNKTFRTKTKLQEHSITHSDARPYPCSLCGKTFKADSHLRIHKLTHSDVKRYKCNMCDKAFCRSSNLQLHRRTHSNARPHKCSTCDMRFKEKGTLRKHMTVHNAIKTIKYKCKLCEKEYSRLENLKLHLKTHPEYRPKCDKSLIEQGVLYQHMTVHNPCKSKCFLCDDEFIHSDDLKTHLMTHTGEVPDECSVCEKKCKTQSSLSKHMKTHVENEKILV